MMSGQQTAAVLAWVISQCVCVCDKLRARGIKSGTLSRERYQPLFECGTDWTDTRKAAEFILDGSFSRTG